MAEAVRRMLTTMAAATTLTTTEVVKQLLPEEEVVLDLVEVLDLITVGQLTTTVAMLTTTVAIIGAIITTITEATTVEAHLMVTEIMVITPHLSPWLHLKIMELMEKPMK